MSKRPPAGVLTAAGGPERVSRNLNRKKKDKRARAAAKPAVNVPEFQVPPERYSNHGHGLANEPLRPPGPPSQGSFSHGPSTPSNLGRFGINGLASFVSPGSEFPPVGALTAGTPPPSNLGVKGVYPGPRGHGGPEDPTPFGSDQAGMVRQSGLPPGAERYPNPSLRPAEESLLPSHASFRTDVVDPQVISQRAGYGGPKERQKKKLSSAQVAEDISTEIEGIIEDLSSKDKFLPSDAIRRVVIGLLNKASSQTGIRVQLKDIEALTKFSRLQGRIDELIKVYCLFTPVTSVHELGVALAQAERVDSYEELKLGPLIKHPKVRDYFKPPDDIDSPPEITVHQLHSHLTKLIDKSKRGSKFSLEDYLEFMRKKEGLETIAHLCVRVQSFPLLIQVCRDGEGGWEGHV